MLVMDVVLDFYFSDGYDGIVDEDGIILNDEMVEVFCK